MILVCLVRKLNLEALCFGVLLLRLGLVGAAVFSFCCLISTGIRSLLCYFI